MARPKIKVCGLTRLSDFELCNELGIDFTGFIFYDKSPRYIRPEDAAAMPKGPAQRVGVFVDGNLGNIAATGQRLSLDLLQLHGGQDVEFCRLLGPEKVVKVFWPERMTLESLQQALYDFAPVSRYFLFDAGSSGGGSGVSFDRNLLRQLNIPRPFFLAGGIGVENAAQATAECSPFALDINSSVEQQPGIKDKNRLLSLLDAIANK